MALVFRSLIVLALAMTSAAEESAVLVEIASGAVVRRAGPKVAATRPGSAVKPFTLVALMEAGVDPARELVCQRRLRLGSHGLNCSHPVAAGRLDAAHALGYSCNSYFAEQSRRLRAEDLANTLTGFGFRVMRRARHAEEIQLQALGEELVEATIDEMAQAYRRLALRRDEPKLRPVFEGLLNAVGLGTAQGAGPDLIGKTGTTNSASGVSPQAWFAGFGPRDRPTHVLVVFVPTGRGASDAAPAAARFWKAWKP